MDKLPVRHDGGPARRALDVDGPTHRSFARLESMVDRATRRKFAWQQSPLAACPQKVKDGVEDGTKVGGSRSPARSRSRQNWRNKSPRCVVHVGGVESSAHRTSYGPSGPDQRSFKTDFNFSNTLLGTRITSGLSANWKLFGPLGRKVGYS